MHAVGLDFGSLQPKRFTLLWLIFTFLYITHWIFGSTLDAIFPLRVNHWKWLGLFFFFFFSFFSFFLFLLNFLSCWLFDLSPSSRTHGKPLKDVLKECPLLNDNAGRDLSPRRMHELNKVLATTLPHPSTIYVACVAKSTVPLTFLGSSKSFLQLPSASLSCSFPDSLILLPLSLFLGLFGDLVHQTSGAAEAPFEPLYLTANDGMISVAGQRHPVLEPALVEPFGSFDDISVNLTRGRWAHLIMPGDWSHFETMKTGQKQQSFFEGLHLFLQSQ